VKVGIDKVKAMAYGIINLIAMTKKITREP